MLIPQKSRDCVGSTQDRSELNFRVFDVSSLRRQLPSEIAAPRFKNGLRPLQFADVFAQSGVCLGCLLGVLATGSIRAIKIP